MKSFDDIKLIFKRHRMRYLSGVLILVALFLLQLWKRKVAPPSVQTSIESHGVQPSEVTSDLEEEMIDLED